MTSRENQDTLLSSLVQSYVGILSWKIYFASVNMNCLAFSVIFAASSKFIKGLSFYTAFPTVHIFTDPSKWAVYTYSLGSTSFYYSDSKFACLLSVPNFELVMKKEALIVAFCFSK